jgi:hypothetical protein
MCGKENPADLETCQFCQARLKPVVGQPPPDGGEDISSETFPFAEHDSQSDADVPDWLKEIRSGEGEIQDFPEKHEDSPEWLSSLRDESGVDDESEDEDISDQIQDFDFPTDTDHLPEWLESLRSSGETGEESLEEQEEDPDWLERIRRRKDEDERIAYRASFDEAEDEAESIPGPPAYEADQAEEEPRQPADDFEEVEPSIEPEISERVEQELTEDAFWLEDETPFPAHETDEDFVSPEVPAFDDEDLLEEPSSADPEWLRRLKEDPSAGVDDEAVTRKLDEFPEESPEEIDESPDEIPDWLMDEPEETHEPPEEEPETLPDWITEEEGAPEPPLSEAEEIPDWLAESITDETSAPPTEAEEQPDVLLDWIAEEEGATETPLPESEEIPDWLVESVSDETPPLPAAEEQLEAAPEDIEAGEVPDWMLEFSDSTDALPSEEEISDIPSEKAPDLPLDEDVELLSVGEEDLAEDLDLEGEEEKQLDEEPAESDLTPADLPAWLEAMRPVESAAPRVRDMDVDIVESVGPLAGLSGVLSTETNIPRSLKDSAYAARLQVTTEQRAHVDLLEEMVAGEGKPRPIPKQSVISPQNILRWAITLVLFIAILWPTITADQQIPMPTFSQETGDVSNLINDLPADARLLVAFDYQPGLSAEMDTTAAAVLDHIMLRGAYLTLVSTSPTGPFVAERFLSQTKSTHTYTHGEEYINMGYIPGGAAGLLSLAASPQRTIPYTTNGVEAWEVSGHDALPPLQGIGSLADFSMVLVLVDDPDVARAWIEQVQPYLADGDAETPLVMVVSAQAEPLIRPYYEAFPRQLQGFVAGMRGGASYARLTGRTSLPSRYWDAFSAGLSVAALLIVVGGVVNVASALISRREPSEDEDQS